MAIVNLTVTGKNFGRATSAKLGGVSYPVTVLGRGRLQIAVDTSTLPSDAPSLPLVVCVDGQWSNAFEIGIPQGPPPLIAAGIAAGQESPFRSWDFISNPSPYVATARNVPDVPPFEGTYYNDSLSGYSASASADGAYLAIFTLSFGIWAARRTETGWVKMRVSQPYSNSGTAGSVAISPDGNYMVAASDGGIGGLYLWTRDGDTWGNRQTVESDVTALAVKICQCLLWSPDGNWLAGSWFGQSRKPRIYSFSGGVLTPVSVQTPPDGDTFWSLGWHPSSNYLLGLRNGADMAPVLYQRSGSAFVVHPAVPPGYTRPNLMLCWSADGKLFIPGTIGFGNTIRGIAAYDFDGTSFTALPSNVTEDQGYLLMLPGSKTELLNFQSGKRYSFASGTVEQVGTLSGVAGIRHLALSLKGEVPADPGPPSITPGPAIDVAAITYTQSMVYPSGGITAATNATMTNGIAAEETATATNTPGWVKMDLGQVCNVRNIYVGNDATNTLGDGNNWGPSWTAHARLEFSIDDADWEAISPNISTVSPIVTYAVNVNARYIRLYTGSYLAVTEFYADSGAGTVSHDPYFSNVSLLLQPTTEADGTTTLTDLSPNAFTISGGGALFQVDADVTIFGGKSIKAGGGYAYAYVDGSNDAFRFPGDFSIEFNLIVPVDFSGGNYALFEGNTLYGPSARTNTFILYVKPTGEVVFYHNSAERIVTTLTVGLGSLQTVMARRVGTTVSIAVNGTADAATWDSSADFSQGGAIIGSIAESPGLFNLISNFTCRVTKGVGRAYAAPTGRFPTSGPP